MSYINLPTETPQNVTHNTYYSEQFGDEIGYNIYLPSDYLKDNRNYPVVYHLHGWQCSESTDIWALEKVYRNRQAITVFANNAPMIGSNESLPVERMILNDLMPHIDGKYRTDATCEGRSVSGFSMGGGSAFYYAAKHPDLFSTVTAYAGTYHHYYHKGYRGVGKPAETAAELYREMMSEKRYDEKDNILYWIKRNVEKIRSKLQIAIHVGTVDPLYCDSEILHLYLDSLEIPHEYVVFEGMGHEIINIL